MRSIILFLFVVVSCSFIWKNEKIGKLRIRWFHKELLSKDLHVKIFSNVDCVLDTMISIRDTNDIDLMLKPGNYSVIIKNWVDNQPLIFSGVRLRNKEMQYIVLDDQLENIALNFKTKEPGCYLLYDHSAYIAHLTEE